MDNHSLLYDKEWLTQKYVEEKLNAREMADLIGCSDKALIRAIKRFKIPTRNHKERIHLWLSKKYPNNTLVEDEEWLRKKYEEEKVSLGKIKQITHTTKARINDNMKKFGIMTRVRQETCYLNWYSKNSDLRLLRDRDWLYDQYINKRKSSTEIAEMIGCTSPTVLRHLRKHNIEVRFQKKRKKRQAIEESGRNK